MGFAQRASAPKMTMSMGASSKPSTSYKTSDSNAVGSFGHSANMARFGGATKPRSSVVMQATAEAPPIDKVAL